MSLITCHECTNQVSSEATTCPKCGAKVKRPPSATKIVLVGFMLLVIAISIVGNQTTQRPAEKTAAEKAKDASETLRFGLARAVAENLKKTLRDPDSLIIETMHINDDSTVACVEYRAKNGFGGINREFLVVLKNRSSQKPSDWNKHCTKEMYDLKWAIR
jgi:hypothetical protein